LDGDQSRDPHDKVVRLEERIGELAAKIESCRNSSWPRGSLGGALVLTGMLLGAIRFDPAKMAAAVAASLGGIAVCGSNGSRSWPRLTQIGRR
jgi:hypothetical protein